MDRRFVFFFKQKTAYEMRISDWSSDVCSSDLGLAEEGPSAGDAVLGVSGASGTRTSGSSSANKVIDWSVTPSTRARLPARMTVMLERRPTGWRSSTSTSAGPRRRPPPPLVPRWRRPAATRTGTGTTPRDQEDRRKREHGGGTRRARVGMKRE